MKHHTSSVWSKIPAHIIPKTKEEMAVIRQECAKASCHRRWDEPSIGKMVGIGTRFKRSTFATFITRTESQADAVRTLQRWVEWVSQGMETNVVLTGNHGVGKTHLAVAVMNTASHLGMSSEIRSFREVMIEIRSTYRTSAVETELSILERLSRCDILVLDDINQPRYSPSEQACLQLLMDKRYRNRKPTVLVTILASPLFCASMGQGVMERLSQGHLVWMPCNWPVFRVGR